jgi:hypothetical protein
VFEMRALATTTAPSTLVVVSLASALSMVAPVPGSAQDFYADVRPMLVEQCMGCHTQGGIAWSMEDPEETLERAREIAGMVTTRRMPPWLAEPGHQEYVGDLSLDADVVGMVDAWREGGFPKGRARPDPEVSSPTHAVFRPDLSIELMPGASYLPDQSADDEYRCFVVGWTGEERGYVTGFRAVPGNLNVAHHVVVHAVDPEMVDRFKELDREEEGLGYRCFGGALPDRLGRRAERDAYEARYPNGVRELGRASWWLAHWAPGMDGHVFPEGTGIMLEPGAGLVVQMHYYSVDARGQADTGSRVDFQVAEHVERPAFHLSQTRSAWLAGERNGSMVVPPGETVTYAMDEDLGSLIPYVARVTQVDEANIEGFEVHSANLHMHAFGHSGEITLTDDNGRTETLLSVPRWDLYWQRDFTFTEPKVFTRDRLEDTTIRVQCTYHNPTADTVYGGYGSYDEMCFNFSYIAVRVGTPLTNLRPPSPS